ncbi:hypothetical protein [Streptomyces kaempferi]|uniref:Uncharacterized protein n=1 Tax=Streptomyces kaempferi TaxID=333725 RepID=A0ABW3XIE1_9ACTN
MAITSAIPHIAGIPDPVSLDEAVALFQRTGHPAPKSTLEGWISQAGVTKVRSGKHSYVSFTALLEIHAVKIRARDA